MRRKYALVFVLIAVMLVASCAPAPTTVPTQIPQATEGSQATEGPQATEGSQATEVPQIVEGPQKGGTLIAAHTIEIQGLDPHKNPAFDNLRVYEMIFNELVTLNDQLEVIPDLADSWVMDDDGLKYTFTLKRGVKFHNGQEMTSADVKASYERILNPDTASPARAFFLNVISIDTPDAYTVVFNLDQPNAALVSLMSSSNAAIVPQSVIERDSLDTEVVGTGPFKLDKWEKNNVLRLVRNDDYFIEGLPYLDAIEYRVLPDDATILAGLRSKTIDMALISGVQTTVLARSVDGLQVLGGAGLNNHVLAFNAAVEPLDNADVRRAISCALDRDALSKAVFLSEALPSGPLSPSIGADYRVPLADLECYTRDVAKAKSLLESAGLKDGFTIGLLTRNLAPFVDYAQVIQAQLKEVGITVNIEQEEIGNFVTRWRNKDFDMYVSTVSQNPDPDYALYRTFYTTGSANVHNYGNPELDQLLDQGRTTLDTTARPEIYVDIQKLIAQDAPFAFLVTDNQYVILQSYVQGFKTIPTSSVMYLRETYLNR